MHRVWAVARNTISQGIRMRVAAVVIVLLLVLLPLMGLTAVGDRTLLGRLQTFVSYGLSLTSLLLCLLTVFVAVYTVTHDIKRHHIFLVVCKPIRRYEIVLGKLLGVVALNAMLLAAFGAIIYGLAWVMFYTANAPPPQARQARQEFFTSRVRLDTKIDMDHLQAQILQEYNRLKFEGRIPEGMTRQRALGILRSEALNIAKSVPPGYAKEWTFQNVRVSDPNTPLFVRYKLRALPSPVDDQVFSQWRVGDFRTRDAAGRLTGAAVPRYVARRDPLRTFVELSVPSSAVADDGYVAVAYFNDPSRNACTVIPEEVQLLYRSGTFTGNFLRALLMIFSRLVFLAAVGVCVSTWLSFPVAILICMAAFVTGTINGFIVESLDLLEGPLSLLYTFTIKPLLWLLPKFDGDYNPTRFIVEGRAIGWGFLGQVYLTTGLIKAGLLVLLGVLIFHQRELAKTAV